MKPGKKSVDRTTPKYAIVEDYIRQQIKQRKIVDKLPGERILAKELGYSYMTIRKAIENLVGEGVLYKIPTKGTFVANPKNRKARTRSIGYFLDSSIDSGISSPYYSLIFNALQKEAARHDYTLVYFSENGEQKLKKILKKLDGVIASCFYRIEGVIQEIKERVPVVVIDNSAADKTIPSVIIDNFSALVETVDYLCRLKHERIGFMTGLEDSDVGKNRFDGYRSGLSRHDIEVDDGLVFRGNYSFQSGIEGAGYFLQLEHLPTAIVCANDSMALGAMYKLQQEGYKVPEDVSVVGFDDINVASQITPSLTTVFAPIEEIAAISFAMLEDLIENRLPENRHVALPGRLIMRQSSSEPRREIVAA